MLKYLKRLFDRHLSLRIVEHYRDDNISIDNDYSERELIMLWYLDTTSYDSRTYRLGTIRVVRSFMDFVLKCGKYPNIKLHGIINDQRGDKCYVFEINGNIICRKGSINYCNDKKTYYISWNHSKIYYGCKYMFVKKYVYSTPPFDELYFGDSIYDIYDNNIGIDGVTYTSSTTYDIYHIPYNFNMTKAQKLFENNPKLFKKMYSEYEI